MKSLRSIIFVIAILLGGGGFLWFSQAQDSPLEAQDAVSRYEMIRLVEEANCQTCLTPPQSWKQNYSQQWLQGFKTRIGNNFDDIEYGKADYDEKNYYYCVAHAGEQGRINGYPRLTQNPCQGQFCGANNARGTELVQMIANMIAPYMRAKYPLSFKAIQDRSVASGVLQDIESLGVINTALKRCGDKACSATNLDEFAIVMKYCTSHLHECQMTSVGTFPQGQRPIAELNLLIQAKILTDNDPMIARLGSTINGGDLARLLPGLKQLTNCQIVDDYDGDGLGNAQDNCPDAYNPKQSNMDGDSKGDVCDDDIDGDGALNDIGIVDDNGNIIKNPSPGRDDCPSVSKEKLGNQDCVSYMKNALIAFDIQVEPIKGVVGQEVIFEPTIVGKVDRLDRDFGDGSQGQGLGQSHYYAQTGIYNVTAKAQSLFGTTLVSQAQVLIGQEKEFGTTALTCNSLTGTTTSDFRCFLRGVELDLGQATMLRRRRSDQTDQQFSSDISANLVQNHRFSKPGTYTIQADLFFGLEKVITQKLVVYVTGESVCSAPQGACDLDKDSIPDQCDADIDGDGVTNIVGIVTKDLEKCEIHNENLDLQKFRDTQTAIRKGVVVDNCFAQANTGQEDSNLNALGDVCDTVNNPIKLDNDRDQDKIPDELDACIDVPENYNGIEDDDGCPELPKSCKPGSKCSGKAPACTTCPCPGADFKSELWKGDRIRAVLMDEGGTIIYRYSPAEVIDVDIPDKMLGK